MDFGGYASYVGTNPCYASDPRLHSAQYHPEDCPAMNASIVELLVLFAVAGFVLYRLKGVIGTRTGYEEPPEYLRRGTGGERRPTGPRPVESAAETEAADANAPEEMRGALASMRANEPGFSLDAFLEGARGAYEMIIMAYQEGDRAALKGLLAPDVFSAFEGVIADREAKGLSVEARFIGVREAVPLSANFDDNDKVADITIRFTGEIITAVRDAENRIVEGDPNDIRRQTDTWTFSRQMGAPDPNWLLTATGD